MNLFCAQSLQKIAILKKKMKIGEKIKLLSRCIDSGF